MQEVTISSRSRNLAFGWETTPQRGTGYPQIAEPSYPGEQGGPATVRRQMERARRILSGGGWATKALFVGGKQVVAVWDWYNPNPYPDETPEPTTESAAFAAWKEYQRGWRERVALHHAHKARIKALQDGDRVQFYQKLNLAGQHEDTFTVRLVKRRRTGRITLLIDSPNVMGSWRFPEWCAFTKLAPKEA